MLLKSERILTNRFSKVFSYCGGRNCVAGAISRPLFLEKWGISLKSCQKLERSGFKVVDEQRISKACQDLLLFAKPAIRKQHTAPRGRLLRQRLTFLEEEGEKKNPESRTLLVHRQKWMRGNHWLMHSTTIPRWQMLLRKGWLGFIGTRGETVSKHFTNFTTQPKLRGRGRRLNWTGENGGLWREGGKREARRRRRRRRMSTKLVASFINLETPATKETPQRS